MAYVPRSSLDSRYVNTSGDDAMSGTLSMAAGKQVQFADKDGGIYWYNDTANYSWISMYAGLLGSYNAYTTAPTSFTAGQPFGQIAWGASGLSAGANRVSLAPAGFTAKYGMTANSNGLLTPIAGNYLAMAELDYTNVPVSQYGPATGLGDYGAVYYWGTTDHAPLAASSCRSMCVALMSMNAGQYISAWYSVQAGISMATGWLHATYVGAL